MGGGDQPSMGGHQPTIGGGISQVWGGHQPSMGGSSTNYGGGHQPSMGGVINQLWGGHQPSMGGGIFPPVCTGSQNRENNFSNTYVLPSVNRTAGPTNRETNDNNNIYHRDQMPGKKYREQERERWAPICRSILSAYIEAVHIKHVCHNRSCHLENCLGPNRGLTFIF